jgi:hypothetical protein
MDLFLGVFFCVENTVATETPAVPVVLDPRRAVLWFLDALFLRIHT